MEYYYPQNDILKKYIRYISFYSSDVPTKEYLVFPNHGAGMVLCRNLEFKPLGGNTYLSKETRDIYRNTLHINRIDPVKMIEQGKQEKITVVFEPLGINRFINEPLSELLTQVEDKYISLEQMPRFLNFSEKVYAYTNPDQQVAFIENYLLERLTHNDFPFVEEAVTMLMEPGETHSVAAISKQVYTSPRNLLRLFTKHMCISPVEFRNIYQFRFSLHRKIESADASLKEVGYESNYSDASYMVKMYKKFTGHTPSEFFDNLKGSDNKYITISL
jgi:AraC-like DNA-binding protein